MRNLSLLAPKVSVYDSQQNLVATASGDYGTVATVSIGGLQAGESYTIVADGATSDEFGMGAYRLSAQLTGNVSPQPTPPIDVVPPTTNEDEEEPITPDLPTVVTVPPTPNPTTPTPTTPTPTIPTPTIPTTPVQTTPTPVSPPVVRSPFTIASLRRLLISGATETGSNDNQADPPVTPTTESTPAVDSTTDVEPTTPVVPSPEQEPGDDQTTEPVEPTQETPVTPEVDAPVTNDETQTTVQPETPTTTGPPVITQPTNPVRSGLTVGGLRRLLLARSFASSICDFDHDGFRSPACRVGKRCFSSSFSRSS